MVTLTNKWKTVFKAPDGNKLQVQKIKVPQVRMRGVTAQGKALALPDAKRLVSSARDSNVFRRVR